VKTKLLAFFLCFLIAFNSSLALLNISATQTTNLEINSETAILIDARTGIVIYEKNMHEPMYPASITKLLTALLAVEMVSDFNNRITHSHHAVFSIPSNSSHIAMNEGETLSYTEALLALMLASANDVSNAIAEDLADSISDFAIFMNKRASELGALNSNFVNPSGLHDDAQVTTAYDMALIMRELIQHEKFLEVSGTPTFRIPPTERQIEERPLNNSNRMIQEGHAHFFEYAVAGKTGWTTPAGNTLVMYGKQGDIELITVVMRAENSGFAYSDTRTLLEHGFTQFREISVFNSQTYSDIISIVTEDGGITTNLGNVSVYAREDVTLSLPLSVNRSRITTERDFEFQTSPPVFSGDVMGQLRFMYDGRELASVNIYAEEDFFGSETVMAQGGAYPSSYIDDASQNQEGFSMSTLELVIYFFVGIVLLLFIIGISARLLRFRRKRKRLARRRARQQAQRYRYRNH